MDDTIKRQVAMSSVEYALYQRLAGAGGFCAFASEALREKAEKEIERQQKVKLFMKSR